MGNQSGRNLATPQPATFLPSLRHRETRFFEEYGHVMSHTPDIPISRSIAFPDLEPAAAARRRKRTSRVISKSMEMSPRIELTHDSALDEEITPSRREEPQSEIARLTVYVLNAIVMVIAFPIGMAVLMFNIIGGENLRFTAHAIALSGMAVALLMTDLGQSILRALTGV